MADNHDPTRWSVSSDELREAEERRARANEPVVGQATFAVGGNTTDLQLALSSGSNAKRARELRQENRRKEDERQEKERQEKERQEKERQEKERQEKERQEKERQEKEQRKEEDLQLTLSSGQNAKLKRQIMKENKQKETE